MKFGIKRILFFTTFLSAALPMLLVGIVSLYMLKTQLRNEMERASVAVSLSIAEQIRSYLRQPVRVLSLARDHIENQSYLDPSVEQYFDDVLRTHDYFESIYHLDRSGLVRQISNNSDSESKSDLHGMDFSSLQSFQEAIRDKHPSWSSSQTLSGGEPTIALCLAARDGVIMANLRLVELSRIINEASQNHFYTAFIVDKGGRIIAHPNNSLVERRENIGNLPLLRETSQNVGSGLFDFQNTRYHATVVPIIETQWKLVVAKRLEDAEQPIYYFERTFLCGIGIMFLLVSFGAVIGNRIISKPFRQMEHQSRLVAEGRFDEVASVESRCYEIALLSDTISAMAMEVQQRESKLHDQNDELQVTEEMLRSQIDEYHETHNQLLATEEMLRVQLSVSESNQSLLEESNRKLETMIDASPLAIISLNQDGIISLWNHSAATLFGCSAGDLDHTLKKLFTSEKGYADFISRLQNEQHLRLPEILLNSFDGRPLVVSLISAPLSTIPLKAEFILMVEDVTQRAQLEEQLRQAQKMDIVGQLAGGIAHDFNNMLTGIMASAELMKHRMSDDDRNMKMVNTILNAAARSAHLTRDLLTFSRKGVKESTLVAVNDTISAVIGLLERTIDKNIHLVTSLSADDPIVMGDQALLQNALLNLGVNARDAMPNGGTLTYDTSVTILDAVACRLSQIPCSPGTYLRIAVSDTGAGIPREIMARIFEPFFTTKEQGKGTGLGLAAVYGTVRDHKGGLTVISEPRQGTTFHLFLPLCPVTGNAAEPGDTIIRGKGGILLVDDEEILRHTGCDLLEELGYTVFVAEDGEDALRQYVQLRSSIDLVLLDMVMPKLNGKETFFRLREMNPEVRVLFCSGFNREGNANELAQLGAKGLIRKPYSMNDLGKAISDAIVA